MNATNHSSSTSDVVCSRSVTDDEYIAVDYFFIVLSIIVNLLTCPLMILLNAFIIIAVRTKQRLQTMHNILLACLAGTDLMVGIAAQPVFIAQEIFLIASGSFSAYCKLHDITKAVSICLFLVSLFHVAFIGVERFVAMKYSLRYDSVVTKFGLTIAVACSWLCVTVYCVSWISLNKMPIPAVIFIIPSLLVIIFCHISVYFVCRRHLNQIKSEQVSREAKTKFLEERKAWKTTTLIIGGVFLSYLPGFLSALAYGVSPDPSSLLHRITASTRPLRFTSFMLNSLLNPVIYCWRSTVIRHALLGLLRKQDTWCI